MASERQVHDALEEQNIDTFMHDLIAEAGDKPICDLDLDKAVAAAHGGVDRIKDAAQPPEFDLGDLSGREQKCRVRSPRIPRMQAPWTQGRALRSDLNAHSHQQYRKKSTAEKAKFRLVWATNTVDSYTNARWNPIH